MYKLGRNIVRMENKFAVVLYNSKMKPTYFLYSTWEAARAGLIALNNSENVDYINPHADTTI